MGVAKILHALAPPPSNPRHATEIHFDLLTRENPALYSYINGTSEQNALGGHNLYIENFAREKGPGFPLHTDFQCRYIIVHAKVLGRKA